MEEVIVTRHGGPEVLSTRAAPGGPDGIALADDEVLVRNHYAGINFIDTYYRSGLYQKPALPYVPGEEGAGVVLRVGAKVPDSSRLLNARVAYYFPSSGSYGPYVTVKAANVARLPDGVSEAEGAAALIQGLTAHYLIDGSYPCRAGSVVVVHAAAGGTGLLVCQMAKLRGATVVGVCGGAEKATLAQHVGKADVVIDYVAEPDWAARVRAAFPEGVDAVYDGVGKVTFSASLSVLKKRGYLISFGNASGAVPPVAPLDLMRAGSVYLQRPTMGDYLLSEEETARRVAELFEWVASKKVVVTIGHELPLREAAAAHALLESRKSTGKVLLKID